MNAQQNACSRETIEHFLADRLTEDEQSSFESHLESCPLCRKCLDELAAEEIWWQETRGYLAAVNPVLLEDPSSGPENHDGGPSLFGLQSYLAPTDDPHMLGRVGGYEIAGVIGSGGMGIVLKGFDAPLNRYVAIKVLAPHLALNGAARQRFAREAKAAATVVHDNVMAIHAVAEANGLPYFVMPYVPGPSLEKRLRSSGALALVEILRIGMQIASGLAAAHAQGLVHRDIKPANIMLEEGTERVRITDFGLARAVDDASLTRSGIIAGTPQYMSPEQAAGVGVDHRSDLFSLGSVLYALCTGRPPFRADTTLAVLRRVEEDRTSPIREINPDIPDWLEEIIRRLHAKHPAARFQSATEVATLLEGFLAHLQQPTTVAAPLLQPVVQEDDLSMDVVEGELATVSARVPMTPTLLLLAVSLIPALTLVAVFFFIVDGPPQGPAEIEPQVVFIDGFFNQEHNAERQWRWMGDRLPKAAPVPIEAIVHLRNTKKDMNLRVVGDIPVYAMRVPATIKILFNGEVLEQFKPDKRAMDKTYKVPASKQNKEEYSELRFSCTGFFIPTEYEKKSTDERRMCFRLFRLAWSDKEEAVEAPIVGPLVPWQKGFAANPPNTDPQKLGSKAWLSAALLIGMGFVVAVILTVAAWLYLRNRRPTSTPESANGKDKAVRAATFISFQCAECGKNLKTSSQMAGKKIKCPGCGKTVPAPAAAAR